MSFDPRLLRKLGKLAGLRVEGAEASQLAEELRRVIAYIDLLAEIDPGVPEAPEPASAAAMALRPDETGPAWPREEVLGRAPARAGGEFAVPGVLPSGGESRTGRDDEGRT